MSEKVVSIHGAEIPRGPADVLEDLPRGIVSLTVIGFNAEGNLYFDSSESGYGDLIIALELAKRATIDGLVS